MKIATEACMDLNTNKQTNFLREALMIKRDPSVKETFDGVTFDNEQIKQ